MSSFSGSAPVELFSTSILSNHKVRSRHERYLSILSVKKIPFVYHDLASDEEAKSRWRRKARDPQIPGLLVHNEWRGTFDEFEEAVEFGELDLFLRVDEGGLPPQPPASIPPSSVSEAEPILAADTNGSIHQDVEHKPNPRAPSHTVKLLDRLAQPRAPSMNNLAPTLPFAPSGSGRRKDHDAESFLSSLGISDLNLTEEELNEILGEGKKEEKDEETKARGGQIPASSSGERGNGKYPTGLGLGSSKPAVARSYTPSAEAGIKPLRLARMGDGNQGASSLSESLRTTPSARFNTSHLSSKALAAEAQASISSRAFSSVKLREAISKGDKLEDAFKSTRDDSNTNEKENVVGREDLDDLMASLGLNDVKMSEEEAEAFLMDGVIPTGLDMHGERLGRTGSVAEKARNEAAARDLARKAKEKGFGSRPTSVASSIGVAEPSEEVKVADKIAQVEESKVAEPKVPKGAVEVEEAKPESIEEAQIPSEGPADADVKEVAEGAVKEETSSLTFDEAEMDEGISAAEGNIDVEKEEAKKAMLEEGTGPLEARPEAEKAIEEAAVEQRIKAEDCLVQQAAGDTERHPEAPAQIGEDIEKLVAEVETKGDSTGGTQKEASAIIEDTPAEETPMQHSVDLPAISSDSDTTRGKSSTSTVATLLKVEVEAPSDDIDSTVKESKEQSENLLSEAREAAQRVEEADGISTNDKTAAKAGHVAVELDEVLKDGSKLNEANVSTIEYSKEGVEEVNLEQAKQELQSADGASEQPLLLKKVAPLPDAPASSSLGEETLAAIKTLSPPLEPAPVLNAPTSKPTSPSVDNATLSPGASHASPPTSRRQTRDGSLTPSRRAMDLTRSLSSDSAISEANITSSHRSPSSPGVSETARSPKSPMSPKSTKSPKVGTKKFFGIGRRRSGGKKEDDNSDEDIPTTVPVNDRSQKTLSMILREADEALNGASDDEDEYGASHDDEGAFSLDFDHVDHVEETEGIEVTSSK